MIIWLIIHIDSKLWRAILKITNDESYEKAFYLIGFSGDEDYYVLECFEIKYQTRTQGSIISDPYSRLILSSSLPAGIRILGIAHSHPFDRTKEPKPSSVDLDLAYERKGEVIVTISSIGGASAIAFLENFKKLDIKIESFSEEPKILRVKDMYMVFPWWFPDNLISLQVPRLYGEMLYRLYFHAQVKEDMEIVPPEHEWFFVKQKYAIPHIAFGKLRETTMEYLLNNSITRLAQDIDS